jgi:hypothetical protein
MMFEHFLGPEQRGELEAISTGNYPDSERKRARILILYDEGHFTRDIATEVGLSKGRVRYWRHQYQLRGMAIFPDFSAGKFVEPASASLTPTVGEERSAGHAEYVRDLALSLFDKTQGIHHLGDSRRRVLSEAALLHDFVPPVKGKRSVQSIHNWIRTQSSEEFSPEEQTALAAVIAFLKGKIRQQTVGRLELSPAWQQDLLALVDWIIRIGSRPASSRLKQAQVGYGW